jgi:type I restriction enzyme S subunit
MIAPDALVQRYGAFAEPLMDQVTALERSNRTVASSRDLLLPRLISGQLSVAEAERRLGEAA